MSKSKKGVELFDSYYQAIYKTRWSTLRQAMLKDRSYAAICKDTTPMPWLYPWLTLDAKGVDEGYFLDPASAWAASQLPIKQGDVVLDMCAAPGGKSLVIAKRLGQKGKLVCNDHHPKRLSRLRSIMQAFSAESQWSSFCKHGAWYGMHQPNYYDAVLLDAPCSSERHWIKDEKWLSQWREGRSKRLSILQGSLLASALDAVKPGGFVLYVTCSLSPRENDLLIARIMQKRRFCVKHVDNYHESTRFGVMMLPDQLHKNLEVDGWGPLYMALLQKT